MSVLKCLAEIDKYRYDWENIVKSYIDHRTVTINMVDDIIHESYLRLEEYADCDKVFFNNGNINRSYMFLTIRSICLNIKNAGAKIFKEDISNLQLAEDEIDEQSLAFKRLLDKIDKEMETWNWYDRELFRLYKDTPFSLRKLAKETGISWISIHNTVSNCKNIIYEKFWEDYEDYKNGDYDLI